MQMEIRSIVSDFEMRINDSGEKTIEGYAMTWGDLSLPLGFAQFREKCVKGTFVDYITDASTDTKMLIGHDINEVLGRTKNNTLELREDEKGLWFRCNLPKTSDGNDIYEQVQRGDVDGVSVGMVVLAQEWDETDAKNIIRTITKANLPEISLTAFPAYESTSATTRSVKTAYDDYVSTRFTSEVSKSKLNILSKI